jgi:hypothetical protein
MFGRTKSKQKVAASLETGSKLSAVLPERSSFPGPGCPEKSSLLHLHSAPLIYYRGSEARLSAGRSCLLGKSWSDAFA